MIYRPAVALLSEILEERTIYNTPLGAMIWIGFTILACPVVIVMLLRNRNKDFVETFAGHLATKIIEDEDEDE